MIYDFLLDFGTVWYFLLDFGTVWYFLFFILLQGTFFLNIEEIIPLQKEIL